MRIHMADPGVESGPSRLEAAIEGAIFILGLMAFVGMLLFPASAWAQDKKISELPAGSPAQTTDMIPIARAGANYRLAGSDFLSSAGGDLTGPIRFPNGTASAPGAAFVNSTSTGLYLKPTGDFWETNGIAVDASTMAVSVPMCDFLGNACAGLLIDKVGTYTGTGYTHPTVYGINVNLNGDGVLAAGKAAYLQAIPVYVQWKATGTDLTSGAYGVGVTLGVTGTNLAEGISIIGSVFAESTATGHVLYGVQAAASANSAAVFDEIVALNATGPANASDVGADPSKFYKLRGRNYGRALLDQPSDSQYALELTNGQGQLITGKTGQFQLAKAAGGAKPACAAATRGSFWYEAGTTGVKDTVEICAKDATDTYAWRPIY